MIGIIDVGGGTRGIFGAGVFDYCMDDNIEFDYIAGVSAGSANACSFLSGQRGRNLRFYDNYAFRKEYMSFSQFVKTGSYINLDYIYSTLSNSDGEDPIDYDAFSRNATALDVVVTNALTGKAEYIPKESIQRDNFDCIKASCCVPVVCRPYRLGSNPYYDGGISDPIPYKRAFEKGCDRLVVILTRPKDMFRDPKKDEKIAKLLSRKYPRAAVAVRRRAELYNHQLKNILLLEKEGKALILAPDDIGAMKTLTKDHKVLREMYKKGYKAASKLNSFLCLENV